MLPEHVIRELRYLEVYTAKRMRNLRLGTYTSRLRGAGFDFDEHRLYQPGDDVRRIDWNVTARLNVPFVRETHADRELNVMIALDFSRSMAFGTRERSKKELTLFIAACLVFSGLADQVNVGFVAFADRVLMYAPPRRSRAHVWKVLEEVWMLDPPRGDTAILSAARFLAGHLKKVSTVFLISDFITDEDLQQARDLKVLAATHDVIGVVVEDPAESELPRGPSAISLRDLETGAAVRVGLGESMRQRYQELVRQRRVRLADAFYRVPMDHVFVRSDRSAIEPLLRLFAERRRP
jgi:uncharacterized protein (DUF58 family)